MYSRLTEDAHDPVNLGRLMVVHRASSAAAKQPGISESFSRDREARGFAYEHISCGRDMYPVLAHWGL